MPSETVIKITSGEDGAVVATNVGGMVKRLNGLGFESQETEGTTQYFEVPKEYIVVRKPKDVSGRDYSDEQKGNIKARLTLARAAKNPDWAKANAELVDKWATSHPEVAEKYGISVNGKTKVKGKAKAAAPTKAKVKAADPEPEDEPEEEETPAPVAKKGGLASRVKITR